MHLIGSSSLSLHLICTITHELFSLILTYLPFHFDLTFTVFFHSSVLLHPDLHTDLDNLDSVENNLRHSAKGSLDAYDVTFSLTDFRQFREVACREYTLPRDDGSSQPRGWIQGNMRMGPVLEVTSSYMCGKHGIEIRIWSVAQDNSHSWVRISHGSKNMWLIQITTKKFLQIYLKNKRHNRV